MTRMMMITAILSAVFALITEILCTERKAKLVWLGSISLFFLTSCGAYALLWNSMLSGNTQKIIVVSIVIAICAFLLSFVVASIVMAVIDSLTKPKPEEPEETVTPSDQTEKSD